MICPECKEQGLRSCVTPGAGTSTLMYCPGYYDEDGRYHSHDLNTSSTSYSCSNGHRWTEVGKPIRCWCGWPEPTEKST